MKTLLHVCAFMWIESMLFANSVVKWFYEAIDLERIMSMRILRATYQLKTVWLWLHLTEFLFDIFVSIP